MDSVSVGLPGAESNSSESRELLWKSFLAQLEKQLESQLLAAYALPLELVAVDSSTNSITLRAPSRFVLSHIDRNYRPMFESIFATLLRWERVSIAIEIDPAKRDIVSRPFSVRPSNLPQSNVPQSGVSQSALSQSSSASKAASAVSAEPIADSRINHKYTFENFVVGNSNQFCHAAAMRCAEEPGKSYNPLFIYGGVGLGKTHLLHAIGNYVLKRNPTARVLYMSSETFTNELIQSLRNAKMNEFKTRMRGIEVLLIDDIQFIIGKERTQEEFFHTFNDLHSAHRQIVLSADKIPQDMPGIEERLQTRFSWGLTADLQAPDFETRVAIIKRKATSENFYLPEDVAHFMAEKVATNVRELEGALTRLHAISSLQGSAINMELAKTALKPFLQRKAVKLTSDDIKRAVAQHFGLKASEMISKRRTKSISFPRHVAMYLCRKHTTLSYPEIGGEFGGRDHSSVIHAAQVVSSKISADATVKKVIEEIERALLS